MTNKRQRGRPKGETPPKSSAERSSTQRERQRAEGMREVLITVSPASQARIAWLMAEHEAEGHPVTMSELVGRCVRFAFDNAPDPENTKPEIE